VLRLLDLPVSAATLHEACAVIKPSMVHHHGGESSNAEVKSCYRALQGLGECS
jgi:hypothetical protein